MFIYLQLLTIIAVNRVFAVLKPPSFQSSVKPVIVILFQNVIQHGNEITNVITVFEIALCLVHLVFPIY